MADFLRPGDHGLVGGGIGPDGKSDARVAKLPPPTPAPAGVVLLNSYQGGGGAGGGMSPGGGAGPGTYPGVVAEDWGAHPDEHSPGQGLSRVGALPQGAPLRRAGGGPLAPPTGSTGGLFLTPVGPELRRGSSFSLSIDIELFLSGRATELERQRDHQLDVHRTLQRGATRDGGRSTHALVEFRIFRDKLAILRANWNKAGIVLTKLGFGPLGADNLRENQPEVRAIAGRYDDCQISLSRMLEDLAQESIRRVRRENRRRAVAAAQGQGEEAVRRVEDALRFNETRQRKVVASVQADIDRLQDPQRGTLDRRGTASTDRGAGRGR